MYPDIEKRWVNRCVACGSIGYRPEMPDTARGARQLKRELRPLPLNALGFCDVCGPVATDSAS